MLAKESVTLKGVTGAWIWLESDRTRLTGVFRGETETVGVRTEPVLPNTEDGEISAMEMGATVVVTFNEEVEGEGEKDSNRGEEIELVIRGAGTGVTDIGPGLQNTEASELTIEASLVVIGAIEQAILKGVDKLAGVRLVSVFIDGRGLLSGDAVTGATVILMLA